MLARPNIVYNTVSGVAHDGSADLVRDAGNAAAHALTLYRDK
jgi:hypothetical protein